MIAGGIWDQPAGAWRARNFAARIWQMIERIEKPDFKLFDANFDKSDQDLYKEIIKVQQELVKKAR